MGGIVIVMEAGARCQRKARRYVSLLTLPSAQSRKRQFSGLPGSTSKDIREYHATLPLALTSEMGGMVVIMTKERIVRKRGGLIIWCQLIDLASIARRNECFSSSLKRNTQTLTATNIILLVFLRFDLRSTARRARHFAVMIDIGKVSNLQILIDLW